MKLSCWCVRIDSSLFSTLLLLLLLNPSPSAASRKQTTPSEETTYGAAEMSFAFKGRELKGTVTLGQRALGLFAEGRLEIEGHGVSLEDCTLVEDEDTHEVEVIANHAGQIVTLIDPPKELVDTLRNNIRQLALEATSSTLKSKAIPREVTAEKPVGGEQPHQEESAQSGNKDKVTSKGVAAKVDGGDHSEKDLFAVPVNEGSSEEEEGEKNREDASSGLGGKGLQSQAGSKAALLVGMAGLSAAADGQGDQPELPGNVNVVGAVAGIGLLHQGARGLVDESKGEQQDGGYVPPENDKDLEGPPVPREQSARQRLEAEILDLNERILQITSGDNVFQGNALRNLRQKLKRKKRMLSALDEEGSGTAIEEPDEFNEETSSNDKKDEEAETEDGQHSPLGHRKAHAAHEAFLGHREKVRNDLQHLANVGTSTGNRQPEEEELLQYNPTGDGETDWLVSSVDGMRLNILAAPSSQNFAHYFKQGTLAELVGKQLLHKRVRLLKALETKTKVSRGPIDFYLWSGISERALLDAQVSSRRKIMCQASVANYGMLFPHLAQLGDSSISAPIAAMYRDSLLNSNLPPVNHEYESTQGTSYHALELAKDVELLAGMEAGHKVMIWRDAAIFDKPVRKHGCVYDLPSRIKKASFAVTQKIDMQDLTPVDWAHYKEDLGLYMALHYESVYLAAIEEESEAVLLTPILLNATPEQLLFMTDVALRVHLLLSPHLARGCQVLLSLPEGEYSESGRLQQSLHASLERMAAAHAEVYISGKDGEDTSQQLTRIDTDSVTSPRPHDLHEEGVEKEDLALADLAPTEEPLTALEMRVQEDSLAVHSNSDTLKYYLSRYFNDESEEEELRASLSPRIVSIGSARVLNTNLLISKLIVGSEDPQ